MRKPLTLYIIPAVIILVIVGISFFENKDTFAYIPNAEDGTISVIDSNNDMLVNTIKVDSKLSDGIAISQDGKFIFTGNYDRGELIIVDAKDGEIDEKIRIGKNMHGIDITPDGKFLYLASGDFKKGKDYNYITVFDIQNRKVVEQILTNSQSPAHIDFSKDGSLAYVANIL